MKILMLGDYSNLHACLAKELRRHGHKVTVVSDRGRYMKTDADIELCRKPGLLGGVRYLYRILACLPEWKGYDVVQLINPGFFNLKPGKLRRIYDILRKNNRSVFLTLCGNDHFFVKDCITPGVFRFSEFRVGEEKTEFAKAYPDRENGWLTPAQASYTRHVYDTVDGAMSVLPEYDISARRHMDQGKITFCNIPIDLDNLRYSPLDTAGPVRILVGMRGGMEIQKGTARMLEVCRQLEKEMPGMVEVKAVRNLPLAEYIEELKKSHIVIDQLYSYSPATNALQTMALGRIAASGAQPEYYNYLPDDPGSLFCLSPLEDDATIKERLRALVLDRDAMQRMAYRGRMTVELFNDVADTAGMFEKHWKSLIRH